MSHYSRGADAERKVKAELEADGWWVARVAGSKGEADLVALMELSVPWLIEVKATTSPYSHFPPADRAELKAAAERAGAKAVLAWVRPRKRTVFIFAAAWPDAPA